MKKLWIGGLFLMLGTQLHAQQPHLMSTDAQIAAAVSPLPAQFRETAAVLGYAVGTKGLTQLRAGSGPFICLADDPSDERFHVACYHSSLEPFMARGRDLRTGGVQGAGVDSVRYAEIIAGTLPMPRQPTALYSITAELSSVNHHTGAITGGRPLYVVYIPFATAESTGLPTRPAANMPWIMFPGTPKAHIMFTPTM